MAPVPEHERAARRPRLARADRARVAEAARADRGRLGEDAEAAERRGDRDEVLGRLDDELGGEAVQPGDAALGVVARSGRRRARPARRRRSARRSGARSRVTRSPRAKPVAVALDDARAARARAPGATRRRARHRTAPRRSRGRCRRRRPRACGRSTSPARRARVGRLDDLGRAGLARGGDERAHGSGRGQPAVDDQRAARDERARRRRRGRGRRSATSSGVPRRPIGWRARSASSDSPASWTRRCTHGESTVPGHDGVDADPVADVVDGQRAGQRDHRALGRAVRGAVAQPDHAGDRARCSRSSPSRAPPCRRARACSTGTCRGR